MISIVDDDASMRKAIKRLIESADLVVEEFASAEEFLLSGCSQNSALFDSRPAVIRDERAGSSKPTADIKPPTANHFYVGECR